MIRWLIVGLLLAVPGATAAQRAPSGSGALGIEALGGALGSAVGFGGIYLAARGECEVEDLGCNLENVALGIAAGTAGAALGSYLLGKSVDTNPSGAGAALGAVAGAAAGIGLWHLFTEELDIVNGGAAAVATYVITQGVVTALGSRLMRAIRD